MESNLTCALPGLTAEEEANTFGGSPWVIFAGIAMVVGVANTLAFGIGYIAGSIAANLE